MSKLAKKTAKNQLTLPKAVADRFPGIDYFEVTAEEDRIILRPVHIGGADAVRKRLALAGLRSADVHAALAWARGKHS